MAATSSSGRVEFVGVSGGCSMAEVGNGATGSEIGLSDIGFETKGRGLAGFV